MAPNGTKNGVLTPRQEAAALALASGATQEEAARAASCGLRTLKTWVATLPAFTRRVNELRGEMTQRALGQLTAGMCEGAVTLRSLALKAKSESVRLGAARALLEITGDLRKLTEFEERLTAVEQRDKR